MKKGNKTLTVGTAAVALVALSGGLFAWSANIVTASDAPTVGVSTSTVAGCTTAPINVNMGTPFYDSDDDAWYVNEVTVSGSGAANCVNQKITLAALEEGGLIMTTNTGALPLLSPTTITVDGSGNFSNSINTWFDLLDDGPTNDDFINIELLTGFTVKIAP